MKQFDLLQYSLLFGPQLTRLFPDGDCSFQYQMEIDGWLLVQAIDRDGGVALCGIELESKTVKIMNITVDNQQGDPGPSVVADLQQGFYPDAFSKYLIQFSRIEQHFKEAAENKRGYLLEFLESRQPITLHDDCLVQPLRPQVFRKSDQYYPVVEKLYEKFRDGAKPYGQYLENLQIRIRRTADGAYQFGGQFKATVDQAWALLTQDFNSMSVNQKAACIVVHYQYNGGGGCPGDSPDPVGFWMIATTIGDCAPPNLTALFNTGWSEDPGYTWQPSATCVIRCLALAMGVAGPRNPRRRRNI